MSEWGPWREHDGSGVPEVVRGKVCNCVFEMEPGNFSTATGPAGATGGYSWDWRWWGLIGPDGGLVARIIHYRIRKPRALEQLREIARNPEVGRPRELEDA